jgi:hypothetical protein
MLRIGLSVLSAAFFLTVIAGPGFVSVEGRQRSSVVQLASSDIKAGRPADAIRALGSHLRRAPADERARMVLVLAYLRSGSQAEAVRHLGLLPAVPGLPAERKRLAQLVTRVQRQDMAVNAVLRALVRFEPNRALKVVDQYTSSFDDPAVVKAYVHALRARFDEAAAAIKPAKLPREGAAAALAELDQRRLDAETEEARHFGLRWSTESSQPAKTKDPAFQKIHDMGFAAGKANPSAKCYNASSAAEAQHLCRELLKLLHASRSATQARTPLSLGSVDDLILDAIFYGTFDQAHRIASIAAREYGEIHIETEHRLPGGVSFGMLTIDTDARVLYYETLLDIHGVDQPAVGLPVFSIPFQRIGLVNSDVEFDDLTLGYRTIKNGGIALDFGNGQRVPLPLGMETFGLAFSEGPVRRAVGNFQRLVATAIGLDPKKLELVSASQKAPDSGVFSFGDELAADKVAIDRATPSDPMAGFWREQLWSLMRPQDARDTIRSVRLARELGQSDRLFRLAFESPAVTTEIDALLDLVAGQPR